MRAAAWAGITVFFLASQVRTGEPLEAPLGRVPQAALAAVTSMFPQVRLLSARMVHDEGRELYEIRCTHHERQMKVLVTPDGKIVKRVYLLDVTHLPSTIRKAILAQHPRCVLDAAEQVQGLGLSSYQVLVTTTDKMKVSLELNPYGKILRETKIGAEDRPPSSKEPPDSRPQERKDPSSDRTRPG